MNDMLSLFDERGPVPAPRVAPVPTVRFGCPFGCSTTFGNFPAFLGHLTRHQPVPEGQA